MDIDLDKLQELEKIKKFNWEQMKNQFLDYLPDLIATLVSAGLILIIGLWLIKLVKNIVRRILIRKDVNISVQNFLTKLISISLKILLFLSVANKLGIQTTSFVTAIGAAGLAIGLALQGSLANFAGGILILVFKPFKVNDYISSSVGAEGTVTSIDIFHTKLTTTQNQVLVIPNGAMSNSNIKNFSTNNFRKTAILIRVPYSTDLKQVKQILLETVSKHPSALKNPVPVVKVNGMNEKGVEIYIEVSAITTRFWAMHEDLLITCKETLAKADIPMFYTSQTIQMAQP